MNFPGNLTERISHLFSNDMDEILVFAALFIFLILTDQSDDTAGGFPILIIGVFLVLFLLTGNTREAAE